MSATSAVETLEMLADLTRGLDTARGGEARLIILIGLRDTLRDRADEFDELAELYGLAEMMFSRDPGDDYWPTVDQMIERFGSIVSQARSRLAAA
jgi:hypothetical protein